MRRVVWATCVFLLSCGRTAAERRVGVGDLEFGVRDEDGSFRVLRDGDPLEVSMLSSFVSLRGRALGPSKPELDPAVWQDGKIIGHPGRPTPIEPDGDSYVQWERQIGYLTEEYCCYLCRDAVLTASGPDLTVDVSVVVVPTQIQHDGRTCPAPWFCCPADYPYSGCCEPDGEEGCRNPPEAILCEDQ